MATTTEGPTRVASAATSGKGAKGAKGSKGSDGEDGAPEAKSKKKLIIIAVVALLIAGVGAKFTILAPAAKTSAKPAVVKPVEGPIMPLTDMTLNLQDSHFLRVTIALVTIKGSAAITDTSMASQAIVDEFSNRSIVDLTGIKAREKAKAELVKALEKLYPKQIMDAYYTGFVMQ